MSERLKHHTLENEQKLAVGVIRKSAEELEEIIDDWLLDNREKSLAMTKLEECVMWANKSIALHGIDYE